MWSKSSRALQQENDRKAREQHNDQQSLLRLPPEIRNRIYDIYQSSISADLFILDSSFQRLQDYVIFRFESEKFPALLHLCRQTRTEFLPIFFSKVSAVVHLEALIQRSAFKGDDKQHTFLDFLCDRSIASIGMIRIHMTPICHGLRNPESLRTVARCNTVHQAWINIERVSEDVRIAYRCCQNRNNPPPPCCENVAGEAVDQAMGQVKAMRLHEMDHELCKDDFKKLARHLNWGSFRKKICKALRNDML